MSHLQEYRLDRRRMALLARSGATSCSSCGAVFVEGEKVVRKPWAGSRVYCEGCALRLGILSC
ncbi:MAG: hypothetical protein JRN54_03465 [Nitrososphaerota archaeon]|jgi:hypothetical protein|nr:hypothetical protein [Nitrososphaerota archaeon]